MTVPRPPDCVRSRTKTVKSSSPTHLTTSKPNNRPRWYRCRRTQSLPCPSVRQNRRLRVIPPRVSGPAWDIISASRRSMPNTWAEKRPMTSTPKIWPTGKKNAIPRWPNGRHRPPTACRTWKSRQTPLTNIIRISPSTTWIL